MTKRKLITVPTAAREGLYDITPVVHEFAANCSLKDGLVNVYVRGATAAIMIQENWDDSVQRDVITLLRKLIPSGVWEHTQSRVPWPRSRHRRVELPHAGIGG